MLPIIYIESTPSTNSYLKELLLAQDLEEGTIVATNYQTAGRGQRGNVWESEKGKNLTFSIILFPNFIPINSQFIISQLVSLAIKDTLDNYVSDITIKWPNDIYWQEKKVGGILIENTLSESQIASCVIGIGLNINQSEFISDAPNPISLKIITQQDYEFKELLRAIQTKILFYYKEIKNGNYHTIIDLYKSHLFRKEGYHLYNDGENTFSARIKNVKPTGHLILESENGIEKEFAFKEVRYIL